MQQELTNYQQYQLDNYGDILPEPVVLPSGEIEGTNQEIDRSIEWMELQHQLELHDFDKD